MIWYWLRRFFSLVRWLVVPPGPGDVARVDPDAKCANCGACRGSIRAIAAEVFAPGSKLAVSRIICQHTCKVCGMRWYEKGIVRVGPPTAQPAVARNEVEKLEDLYGTMVRMEDGSKQ